MDLPPIGAFFSIFQTKLHKPTPPKSDGKPETRQENSSYVLSLSKEAIELSLGNGGDKKAQEEKDRQQTARQQAARQFAMVQQAAKERDQALED